MLKRRRLAFRAHGIPHGGVDGTGENAVHPGRSEVDGEAAGDALSQKELIGGKEWVGNGAYFDGSAHSGGYGPSLGGFVCDGAL